MATSKKVTDLDPLSAATADDLLYVVDDPGGTPASMKITVKGLMESNATANLTANGSLVVSGKALVNVVTVAYSSTPGTSSAVPAGLGVGSMWSDGSYVYVVTGASALKRVAISTW